MNGFILVSIYGRKMFFTTKLEEAQFALKLFGEDWHIEEYFQEPYTPKGYSALDVMGYVC